jgi:hypothetical protein
VHCVIGRACSCASSGATRDRVVLVDGTGIILSGVTVSVVAIVTGPSEKRMDDEPPIAAEGGESLFQSSVSPLPSSKIASV